ncbi:MAG: tetratricopeptide repeat protein [Pyrinomonadaceae bacterium]
MKTLNNRDLSISSFVSVFVYTCFIVFIGYSVAWQGLSHYFSNIAFRSGSETNAAAAVSYLPENPNAHKTLGEVFLRNKDYSGAEAAFESAIAFSQNDFLLWLRLGYSRSLLKEFGAAETAYQRALELAPNYSQPNYYMGIMLLETGRNEDAFRYLSKAADRDPELYPQMLHRARISFPDDPLAIESAFHPTSRETKKLVARYLIKHNFMTENAKSFLVSEELSNDEKNEFIQYLLHKENFQVAREVWLSRLKSQELGLNDLIFDGSFEAITESDPSGLGWQINQKMTATAVARDQKTFHSGSSSLKVKFAGNVEIGKDIVSQLAYVQPDRKYSLRVFLLSPDLVSAGLPAMAVSDGITNEMLGKSEEFHATAGKWVEYKCEFVAKEAPIVRINLQRIHCNTSPCPIFGELFLDDFRLVEIQFADQ